MKQLLQMAALALSALGSLFTNVDTPKAHASTHRPQATVAAPSPAMQAGTPGGAKTRAHAMPIVVVFDGRDPLHEQIAIRIRQAPSVKAPVGNEPWYVAVSRSLDSSTGPAQRCETTDVWVADGTM